MEQTSVGIFGKPTVTTLIDLAGPYPPSPLASRVGYADRVPEWSLAGNDKFGDCVFAALANFNDLVWAVAGTPMAMSEAEAEFFYHVEAGFSPGDKATDKGAVLQDVIEYWCKHGWPGDTTLKPLGYAKLNSDEIPVAIQMLGGSVAWLMLPSDGRGGYDFETTDREGDFAHAVFVDRATWNTRTFVTWAGEKTVSVDWWAKYGREAFGVLHPNWTIPRMPVS